MIINAEANRLPLPDKSVHCIVTSPPYWGLRDYGVPPRVWGGDPSCEHAWGAERRRKQKVQRDHHHKGTRGTEPAARARGFVVGTGASCEKCGAWRGHFGQESLHDCLGWATGESCGICFICHLREVARELWRVLRDDGTFWLNLGDCYATQPNGRSAAKTKAAGTDDRTFRDKPHSTIVGGLKEKDLVGIPWRAALALQADGWYLRSDPIWYKLNPMPDSADDRPGKSHEYFFMLTKKKRYYYDAYAVRQPAKYDGRRNTKMKGSEKYNTPTIPGKDNIHAYASGEHERCPNTLPDGAPARNLRTVWEIATLGYKGAHFATYPPDLIVNPIKASTSAHGVCDKCGAPYKRMLEVKTNYQARKAAGAVYNSESYQRGMVTSRKNPAGDFHDLGSVSREFLGWVPGCKCAGAGVVPAIVFDPFNGSGTTGVVAGQLGRRYIGTDLSFPYLLQARERLGMDALDAWENGIQAQGSVFADLPLFQTVGD